MYVLTATALAVLAIRALAYDITPEDASRFENAHYYTSAGGHANCVSGLIPVNISTQNENIKLNSPASQPVLSEFFVELLQTASNTSAVVNGGMKTVKGTYSIYSNLCFPKSGNVSSTIQFLTHGFNFDSYYWDIAPGYSYIDAIAAAGYPSFSYDRLGTGKSDHPDPIQVVQAKTEREIGHQLLQLVRSGFSKTASFSKVVGVGHSYGSILTVGVTAAYPKDFDALILTGFSVNSTGMPIANAALDATIANIENPQAFGNLSNGYFTLASPVGNMLTFYRYPAYDLSIFNQVDARKQPYALGEILTISTIIAESPNFTGPVDVVDGENDFIFCSGNCLVPDDQSAQVQPALFPRASKGSQHFIVPGTGHAINAHKTAGQAFKQMLGFLQNNSL